MFKSFTALLGSTHYEVDLRMQQLALAAARAKKSIALVTDIRQLPGIKAEVVFVAPEATVGLFSNARVMYTQRFDEDYWAEDEFIVEAKLNKEFSDLPLESSDLQKVYVAHVDPNVKRTPNVSKTTEMWRVAI